MDFIDNHCGWHRCAIVLRTTNHTAAAAAAAAAAAGASFNLLLLAAGACGAETPIQVVTLEVLVSIQLREPAAVVWFLLGDTNFSLASPNSVLRAALV